MPDDLDFLDEPRGFRRRPPAQRSNNVLLIFAVAIVAALSGAFVAVKVLDEREQPPPQTAPQPAPQPVIAVKPPPAAVQPKQIVLQPEPQPPEETEAKRIEEFETKVSTIRRRQDSDSIPGNAVPRKQFFDDVMGKTADEVLQSYGKPDRTSQSSDGTAYWVYKRRTYDPLVGKPDSAAFIWLDVEQRVVRVHF